MGKLSREAFIDLAGGRIRCRRCQALSKRSRVQCKKPALRGKHVCDFHGGKSTGPKTEAGRQRIADTKTIHGEETHAKREQRSRSSAYMAELEDVARAIGLVSGARTRGRKARYYHPIKTFADACAWIVRDRTEPRHE